MAQKKQTRQIVSVAASTAIVAAALGTGAFALWSDSNLVDGAAIENGDLDIVTTAFTAEDATPDRADGPHAIDLATWRAVPGDVVELDYDMDLALRGDNLVAELVPTALENAIEHDAQLAQYISVEVVLVGIDGQIIAPDENGRYLFQADGVGQAAGVDHATAVIVDSERIGADVTARVTIKFAAETPGRLLTNEQLYSAMTDGVIELNQIVDLDSTEPTPTEEPQNG